MPRSRLSLFLLGCMALALVLLRPPGGEPPAREGEKLPEVNRAAPTDRYGEPLPPGALLASPAGQW